jgi:SAM-dependent methyltransferase
MDSGEYLNMKGLEEVHWWYRSTHRAVLQELERVGRNAAVLDAGCGTGGLLILMNGYFRTFGLDACFDALQPGVMSAPFPSRLTQGSIDAIPFKEGQFAAVTCIDVIYHRWVTSDSSAISQINRVLKPGGYLILQVPAFECLRGGHDAVVGTRKRYTRCEVDQLLRKAGFRVLKSRYRYPWLFIPAFFVRHSTRNRKKSDLRPLPPLVNNLLERFSRIGDASLFRDVPFGTSVFAVAQKPNLS